MNQPVTFADLVGPDRELSAAEDQWLADLVGAIDVTDMVIRVGDSLAGDDPGPVAHRTLEGWRAGRYVGELRYRGRVLEIRPRLGVQTLAEWAAGALNLRVVPHMAAHHGTAALVAELLAATWRASLVHAARHGLPGLRAPRQHEGLYARGRLDVPATLRLRAAGSPHIASIAHPRVIDNPVARSIVLADRVLDQRVRDPDWRGNRVNEIMPRLRAATGPRPRLPSASEMQRVRYTPITLPYKGIAHLSWQIARRRGLHASATDERVEGLLLDVAELWELFLIHCARRAFGSDQVWHGTRLRDDRALLHSSHDRRQTLGRLYPDLLIGPDPARPRAVIDAKYKPLAWSSPEREDLYQLAAYLTAHQHQPPPAGSLAYPRFDEAAATVRAELLGPWHTSQRHLVSFKRLAISTSECVEGLRAIAM